MLEGLDQIDWSELKHANGSAEDIPNLLRNLTSEHKDVRDNALILLEDYLAHQNTIYEASIAAIPFFIELLSADTIQYTGRILELIRIFSPYDVPKHPFPGYITDALMSRDMVAKGLPIYLKLLDDADWLTRGAAAHILFTVSVYPTDQLDTIAAALERRIGLEDNLDVKATAIYALGSISNTYRDHFIHRQAYYIDLLYHHEQSLTNEILSIIASVSLACIAREKTPQATVDRLVASRLHPPLGEEKDRHGTRKALAVGFGIGRIDFLALIGLNALDTRRFLQAVSAF